MNTQQFDKVKSAKGFIAALDQSGGSTPKALGLYGIKQDAYSGVRTARPVVERRRRSSDTSRSSPC